MVNYFILRRNVVNKHACHAGSNACESLDAFSFSLARRSLRCQRSDRHCRSSRDLLSEEKAFHVSRTIQRKRAFSSVEPIDGGVRLHRYIIDGDAD